MTEESPEARTARVLRAQEKWVPRHVPSTPREILAEWMAQSPENRMSKLGHRLADPALECEIEVETFGPGRGPEPGGLIERWARVERIREARARAELDALNRSLPPSSRIY